MTEKMLIQLESRYPDILTMESGVRGLHYLYEMGLVDKVAIAPSGGVLAYVRQEPVLRLTAKQAVEMAHELLALLEVET